MKRLFISRSVNPDGVLSRYCSEHDIVLHAESLIRFEAVSAADFPSTDVIFFTSPRSVHFYLKQARIAAGQQLATVGSRTEQVLLELGHTVHFVGATPTQPERVAKDFKQWLDGRTVLFPQSDRSNQTMQKVLDSSQCINRVVYKTIGLQHVFSPEPDVLIFSSPSNAQAYLECNQLKAQQHIIAYGTTTANFLHEKGYTCSTLPGINEEEIVDFLQVNYSNS